MVEDHFQFMLGEVACKAATWIPHDVTHRVVDKRFESVLFDASPRQRIVKTA